MIQNDFIQQLEQFNLALKKNSTELRQGEQKSSHTGHGMVFEDHKKYIPGDDIRKIDWKAYARTGDLFIKRFEEEKSITVHILVDRSSSMDYGNENKYDHAAKLGLATAYMTSQTNDRFRYSVFSETITDISSGRRNLKTGELIETLNQLRKTPESRIERCITEYSRRIKNKSLLIVISDFLTDTQQIQQALERLEGTETLLVNTLSPQELNPNMKGDKILKDPESNSKIRTYLSRKTKNSYQQELQQHTQKIEKAAQRHGTQYLQLSTGEPVFENFLQIYDLINT
ncbi:MAG: DUF58 domain-containing protein, partial [Candidatus Nanohaloarchaea archaeon]